MAAAAVSFQVMAVFNAAAECYSQCIRKGVLSVSFRFA